MRAGKGGEALGTRTRVPALRGETGWGAAGRPGAAVQWEHPRNCRDEKIESHREKGLKNNMIIATWL